MKKIKYKEEYLDYLSKNYSKTAVVSYFSGLKIFNHFLEKNNLSIEELELELLNGFIEELSNKFTTNTINVYVNGIKNYLSFIKKNYNLELKINNDNIKRVRRDKKVKTVHRHGVVQIKIDDVLAKILASNSPSKERDYLIIQLIIKTGIRISELIKVKKSEIDQYVFDNELLSEINEFVGKSDSKSKYLFRPISQHAKNEKYKDSYLTARSVEMMIKNYFGDISYNNLKRSYYKSLVEYLPEITIINKHLFCGVLYDFKDLIKSIDYSGNK